jgi:hypothetical protein
MISLLIGRAVAEVHVHAIRAVRPVAYSDDDGRRKQSSNQLRSSQPCKPCANYLNLKALENRSKPPPEPPPMAF